MSDVFENKGALAATIVVAASDSLNRGQANYVCDGVNDHLEIQAALDALPAGGGEVVLSEGTFNVQASINLDSYQTLRGCGRNSILTTATANLYFLSAVGVLGTELQGIVIKDMQIDGGVGTLSHHGIYFKFVDHSFVHNVYSRRHNTGGVTHPSGIYLLNSDFNTISNNLCAESYEGIMLDTSDHNSVTGNTCPDNSNGIDADTANYNTITGNVCTGSFSAGIELWLNCNNNTIAGNVCTDEGFVGYEAIYVGSSDNNTIIGNYCQGYVGIWLDDSNNNTVSGNVCQGNRDQGIFVNRSDNNVISDNICTENSQGTNNTKDDIFVTNSSYNNIQGNICRAGTLVKKPRYGININEAGCVKNLVADNDLYNDGFGTAPFNDAGTGTKLNTYKVPFSDGFDPQDSGFLIDANTEYARAWLRLPDKVVQVVRMKVYARSVVAEADKMRGEFVVYGGADNEAYNTHNGSVANHPSSSSNFAADDVIYWTLTTAGILALLGGDSIEVKVLHEAAGNGDCATNAYLRTVEIEYV